MGIALGIDIGTTKAAAVIYDVEKGELMASASQDSKADLRNSGGRHEQDAAKIFAVLDSLLDSFDAQLKAQVSSIGATGQMHGVLLSDGEKTSPLATWKDARATASGRIAEIIAAPGCEKLKDGFGFATLACLAAEDGLKGWTSASTIHDFLVARICGLEKPVCDPTDAASWGLFDVFENCWNFEALNALGIPASLAPRLVPAGAKAGNLSKKFAEKWGLNAGIPVAAALGDNQASILATSKAPDEEIYLTIGTGAQLSAVVKPEMAKTLPGAASMELRPFLDGRLLAVSAPLCGGQAFAWLVKSLASFMKDLGAEPPPEKELYAKLDALAMKSKGSPLRVKPNFLGERHDPKLRGEILNIGFDDFTLGGLAAALALGIVANMRSMMPDWVFEGRKKAVASGNAMRRLAIMRAKAEEVFKLPLEIPNSKEEAACGAAMLSARLQPNFAVGQEIF